MTIADAAGPPTIDLSRPGPTEADWSRVTDGLPPFEWPPAARLVVVSPHPDDETLGAGGLIALAADAGLPMLIVAVTDGEAASAESGLAERRRDELSCALTRLVPAASAQTRHLGIPDGAVGEHVGSLHAQRTALLRPSDLVVCPMLDDGHPDHGATAAACASAAGATGAAIRWFPVWAWHSHRPAGSSIGAGRRLELGAETRRRKRAAIACYVSQTGGDDPVVPPAMLARLERSFEVFIDPCEALR